MPPLDYLFIVNPIAGGNDKTTFYRFIEIESKLTDFTYKVYTTTGEKDIESLQDLVTQYAPNIMVAVGGDGTLLLVAQIAKNTNIKIGLIPFGSANGMSKELCIPKIRTLISV